MTKIILKGALLAILPVSELRGALPYMYFNDVNIIKCFLIAVLCNAMVYPIGIAFLNTLHKILSRWVFYRSFFDKTVIRARKKVSEKVNKYGLPGLMVFVAIPLPITGAWTGTIGAWALGLDKKKSFLAIFLGVIFSGLIVTGIIYAGVGINSIFIKRV